MRTTVNIADDLLAAAKRLAREQGASLGSVIDDALRRSLYAAPRDDDQPAFALPVHHGSGGVRPGVHVNSNRELTELLDEATPLDQLR